MTKRIIFGTIMIAVLVGLMWLDWYLQAVAARGPVGLPLAGLLTVLAVVGFTEVARLLAANGIKSLPVAGLAGAVGLATMPFWWQLTGRPATAATVIAVALAAAMGVFLEQMIRARTADALRRVAGTMLAVFYLGLGLAMIGSMRVQFGMGAFVLFLSAVKLTDIGAYFTGSFIGKHKLILWLSKGKTWEGLGGGLAAAVAATLVLNWVLGVRLPVGWAIAFGLLVGAVGQFGDLCESLMKRSAEVKDSGKLVPEFGGVLDIIDSPLLASSVAYVILATVL